jgi:exodeoxyribonuclease VII large subunit
MKPILSVSELTLNIKFLLESSFSLIWIEGEISNLRRPPSGHVYFTLKDEKSQIRAVVFRQSLQFGKFILKDGMQVVCRAAVTVYDQRGEYQLVIDRFEPKGIGALQVAFEQLKARLHKEGLFDIEHKRRIPCLPTRIGVITSPSGAVIRDILTITARRCPSTHILISPVKVQGLEAASEIVTALEYLNRFSELDLIIIARGGGSLEDLAPFNDEHVARAVYNSKIPVVSAVGHEVDFTICDFVADLRAPTPSAAAELVTPIRRDLLETISDFQSRLFRSMHRNVNRFRSDLKSLHQQLKHPRKRVVDFRIHLDIMLDRLQLAISNRVGMSRKEFLLGEARLYGFNPAEKVRNGRLMLENSKKNLRYAMTHQIDTLKKDFLSETALLNNMNPLAVLQRGYSIVRLHPGGGIIRNSESVSGGSMVDVQLSSGELKAEVREIKR